MNKIIKKANILFTALLSLSIGSNYIDNVNEVKADNSITSSIDFSNLGYVNQQEITSIISVDEFFTITFDKGTNNNMVQYYTSDEAIRVYGGGYFIVTSNLELPINSISLTYSSSDNSNTITADCGVFDGISKWTGSSSVVTFTIGGTSGHRKIQAIEVTFGKTINEVEISDNQDEENTKLSYVFSEYPVGKQYADNEEHVLDDNTIVTTTQCHFTTQLRIYSSSSNNGFAIISSKAIVTKLEFSAGHYKDTLNVYGSKNGSEWILIEEVNITSTSYTSYSVDIIGKGYSDLKYLKLDVVGLNQVRIDTFSLMIIPLSMNDKLASIETLSQLDFSYKYSASSTTKEATISYNGESKNMTGKNDATLLGLDSSLFTVVGTKINANNNIGLNKNGEIRMYNGGNTITITSVNVIESIVFNPVSTYTTDNISIMVNGSVVLSNVDDANKYTIGTKELVINNSEAFYFTSLIINYKELIYSDFKNVNLRYSATIPSDLFENVKSYGINIKIGENSKDFAISNIIENEEGNSFALVIKNITEYNVVINATAYVVLNDNNDTRINLKTKSLSVLGMVDYYLENIELTNEQLQVLNAFKTTNA